MQLLGNYTLSSLWSSTKGPFNVTLTDVVAKGNASVAVERDGKIRTQEISMDMTFQGLTTDFKNLGRNPILELRTLKTISKIMRDSFLLYFPID